MAARRRSPRPHLFLTLILLLLTGSCDGSPYMQVLVLSDLRPAPPAASDPRPASVRSSHRTKYPNPSTPPQRSAGLAEPKRSRMTCEGGAVECPFNA